MNNKTKTVIQRIRSLPDKVRILVLYALLVDPDNFQSVLILDERGRHLSSTLLRDIGNIERSVAVPIAMTLIEDCLHILDVRESSDVSE